LESENTQGPIPESLHFFGSGLMGRQPLGDVALFLATSWAQVCSWCVGTFKGRAVPSADRGYGASRSSPACARALRCRRGPQARAADRAPASRSQSARSPSRRNACRWDRRGPRDLTGGQDDHAQSGHWLLRFIPREPLAPGWWFGHPLQWPISCRRTISVAHPCARMISSLTMTMWQLLSS
jgi:hypothetical protein